MPVMRKAVLEDHLRREARFGHTIWIYITQDTRRFLVRYRKESGRTYHDLFRIILAIYKKRPNFFTSNLRGGRSVVNIRISKQDAVWCLNKAWLEGKRRAHFLGLLVDTFVKKIPKDEIIGTLAEQKDRVLRLIGG